MAKKYLDYDGLLYFWQKLKTAFSTKAEGVKTITRSGTTFTVTRADDTTFTFTQQDNTVAKTTTTPKMNGTAAIGSETKYAAGDHVHPTDTSRAPLASPALTGTPTAPTAAVATDNTQIATTAFVHDVVDALDTGVSDVKIGTASIVTDGVATIPESGASTTGLMTGAQYTKLNGIAAGAEVNQNAFSNVKVGSTTVAADSKTDTLELAAGTNISLTPDADTDKVTIAFSGTIPTLKNVFGKVKVGSTTIEADTTQDTLELAAGTNISLTPDATNDKVTIGFSGSIPTKTTTTPKMNGTAAVGSETKYAAGDHVHPSDTSRVPTTRKVNGKALSSDVTLTGEDIPATSDSGSDSVSAVIDGLATTVDGKVDKIEGKGLSTNDYTTTEKNKLSGIAAGAEVNQNAFSNVKVKATASATTTTTVAADAKTDTLSLEAGNYIELTADATNDKITVGAVLPMASSSPAVAGLMSSADKGKLDGISGSTLDLVAGSNVTITPNTEGGSLTISATNTTYTAGTASDLNTGTNTTNKVWGAKVIADYVKATVETAVTGAAAFQGTAPTSFAPTNYKAGYYWVIGTAGTYAGQVCEPGDMIFAINDYDSAYSASDFDAVQTNLDITSITNAEIDTIVAA